MHDDNRERIALNGCPYDFDWTQESYCIDAFNQFQNHQTPNGRPLNREGRWLKQAFSSISMFDEKDREEERKRKKKNG